MCKGNSEMAQPPPPRARIQCCVNKSRELEYKAWVSVRERKMSLSLWVKASIVSEDQWHRFDC